MKTDTPDKRLLLTDAAQARRRAVLDQWARQFDSVLLERNSVPGEDTIEATASDVDEAARSIVLYITSRHAQRVRIRKLVVSAYLIIGLGLFVSGVFLPYVQYLLANPVRRLLLITGSLMIAAALFLRSYLTARDALGRQNEFLAVLAKQQIGGATEPTADPVLSTELDQLQRHAADASKEVAFATAPAAPLPAWLLESSRSPKFALIALAADIERELRNLLATTGWHGGRTYTSLPNEIQKLSLPDDLRKAVEHFWAARTKLIHGGVVAPDEVARALDSGLTILHTLQAIPREVNVVHHPGVDVYADANGQTLRPGVKAVILETTRSDGTSKELRVFPTTRSHFRPGMRVAWEWDDSHRYEESWYRDPDTQAIKYGWTGSLEFVGRPIEDPA